MVLGIISEKIRIQNVNPTDITATVSEPKTCKVCAPTPAAPTVFATVLIVKIAARGLLISSFNACRILPLFGFDFMRVPIWEWVTERMTDSSIEQINETPRTMKI